MSELRPKCCANCLYSFKLYENTQEYYCQGGGPRFADIVDGDSVCDFFEEKFGE